MYRMLNISLFKGTIKFLLCVNFCLDVLVSRAIVFSPPFGKRLRRCPLLTFCIVQDSGGRAKYKFKVLIVKKGEACSTMQMDLSHN